MTQPRYSRQPGVRFTIDCPHPEHRSLLARSFATYDAADIALDAHERTCPEPHTINRQTTICTTDGNRFAIEALRTVQAIGGVQ